MARAKGKTTKLLHAAMHLPLHGPEKVSDEFLPLARRYSKIDRVSGGLCSP